MIAYFVPEKKFYTKICMHKPHGKNLKAVCQAEGEILSFQYIHRKRVNLPALS